MFIKRHASLSICVRAFSALLLIALLLPAGSAVAAASTAVQATFGKSLPANGAQGQAATVLLSWSTTEQATAYEYCIDAVDNGTCDATWVNTGSAATATVNVDANVAYYWQVRTVDGSTSTYADGGSWWTFTTGAALHAKGGQLVRPTSPRLADRMASPGVSGFAPLGTNLIQDQSFELYWPNPYWTEISPYSLCDTTDCGNWINAGPRSGSAWAWLGGSTLPLYSGVYQAVEFPGCGAPATLSFFLWATALPGATTSDVFRVYVDSTQVFGINATQDSAYSSYTLINIDVSAFSNGGPHTIYFESNITGHIASFNVDDVFLFASAPAGGCSIAGNTNVGGVALTWTDGTSKTTTSDNSGNYSINVPYGWSGTITATDPCYTFSPLYQTFFNVWIPLSSNNFTAVANPAAGCVDVGVTIGGTDNGHYKLASGGSRRQSYTNVDAGPVNVVSTDGVTPIIASERVNLKAGAGASSYSEFMGVPGSKLSDTYLFPWYNNATAGGVSSELRFATVGGPTTVTVTIAGVDRGTYPLDLNGSARVTYTDLDNGPVQIKSSGNVAIVASERIQLKKIPSFSSYTELLGLSASSTASTKYMFPWYNNATSGGVDSQLRFGNVGGGSTTVTVKIGGVVQNTYDLIPNQSMRISYTNIDNGPVEVYTTNGVPIIAAERINLKTMPSFNSYTELMGLPGVTLTETRYVFPIYTDTTASGLEGQLRFGNVGAGDTIVTVKIGGVVQGTYPLAINGSQRVAFSGLDTGPVEVYTTNGVPIIASMRVNMAPNATYSSNAEMMGLSMGTGLGLPGNQLSTSYWFPWYNNATYGGLDSQLRFGRP